MPCISLGNLWARSPGALLPDLTRPVPIHGRRMTVWDSVLNARWFIERFYGRTGSIPVPIHGRRMTVWDSVLNARWFIERFYGRTGSIRTSGWRVDHTEGWRSVDGWRTPPHGAGVSGRPRKRNERAPGWKRAFGESGMPVADA